MKLFTIGFTKTTAESFFSRLSQAGVKKVIDIRLNNASQLAGFAKKTDLIYFLKTICGIDYEHRLHQYHPIPGYVPSLKDINLTYTLQPYKITHCKKKSQPVGRL